MVGGREISSVNPTAKTGDRPPKDHSQEDPQNRKDPKDPKDTVKITGESRPPKGLYNKKRENF